jgi:glutamine synthetase
MAVANVIKMIKEGEVKFVDLRFTDTRGKEQHVSIPARIVTEDWFEDGHPFDGSSIAGWTGIQASDMLLKADPDSAYMDPDLRRDRAVRRQGLRARSAFGSQAR